MEAESSVDFIVPGLLFHPMPQLSTTRPNFPSLLCFISIMDTVLPPSGEPHVSLLLLASVMAALVEEGCLPRPSDPEYGPAVTSPSRKPKSAYEGGLGVPVTMSARL